MIRILLAEEHAVIREGLKQIVAINRDMSIAGEVSGGQSILDEITKNPYDVIVLDVSTSRANWLDVLRDIKSQKPNLPVLVLSAHNQEDNARRAFRGGASGYLTTEFTADELVAAVRKVSGGGKYVSTSLGETLALDLVKGEEKERHESLSDREYQVMGLLASGRTVSEIAQEMSLSVKTVSTYRTRLLEKLNLKNNVELARYYTRFVDTRAVRCGKCGQDNPQVARFCAYCGAALEIVEQSSLPPSNPQTGRPETRNKSVSFSRTHTWFAVTLVVATIAVVVTVWRIQSAPPSGIIPTVASAPATPPADVVAVAGLTAATPTEVELKYDNGTPGPSDVVSTPLLPTAATPVQTELKYDDGFDEAILSSSGGGYLTGFSPPSVPFTISKIRMYGMRHPSQRTEFLIQIWDSEQKVLFSAVYPLTRFLTMAESNHIWTELEVPDIEVKSDFFIHLYAGSYKEEGIALGADNSVINSHSDLTTKTPDDYYVIRDAWPFPQGNWWADKDQVNWMIRVVGQSPTH